VTGTCEPVNACAATAASRPCRTVLRRPVSAAAPGLPTTNAASRL